MHRFVVCPQPDCDMYGIWRRLDALLIGPNLFQWPRVVCACTPDAEIPLAVMTDGTLTQAGLRFPQQPLLAESLLAEPCS